MPDPRFFQTLSSLTVAALAERIGGEVVRGGEVVVSAVAPLSSADRGAIAFLGDRKFAAALAQTKAGCVIVPPSAVDAAPADAAVIVSGEAQAAWARASALLHRPIRLDRAITAAEAAEDDTVVIEPGVILGEGVRIGRGSRIGANTVIGPGVQIGRDCLISAGVTVGFALLGDRVKLLAAARIGEADFGAAAEEVDVADLPIEGTGVVEDEAVEAAAEGRREGRGGVDFAGGADDAAGGGGGGPGLAVGGGEDLEAVLLVVVFAGADGGVDGDGVDFGWVAADFDLDPTGFALEGDAGGPVEVEDPVALVAGESAFLAGGDGDPPGR